MSWRIITDEATQTAALISDDPLYALGPVIEADTPSEAHEAVEAFATACDPPPDQQPTIRLMAEWQSYVQYLAELQQQAIPSAQATANAIVVAAEAPESHSDPGAPSGPEDAPDDGYTLDDAAADAEAAGDHGAAAAIRAHANGDPGPITGQQQVCWCCGGSGKLNLAGTQTDCNVCQGSGLVEAVSR